MLSFDESGSDLSNFLEASPVIKAFLAGSLSGTMSTVLFQPLDLVKTKLQQASVTGNTRTSGMVQVVNHILKTEQVRGLWRGMTPSITRTIPGVGLYFSSMHWLTKTFTDGTPNAVQAVAIGVTARSFSVFCLIPITVVKTRIESGEFKYRGVSDALKMIYSREGLRGLTCGLIPTIVRDAPFSGIYLMFYTQLKSALPPNLSEGDFQAGAKFGCGIVSGVLASVVTQPADVIKTKMQLYPDVYPNTKAVLLHLHEKYGYQGYFKGLAPRMLRRTLVTAMAWSVYEQVTRVIGLK